MLLFHRSSEFFCTVLLCCWWADELNFGLSAITMTEVSYTAAELLALRRYDVTPPRAARKFIFSCRLWRPRIQRRHCERQHCSGFSHSPVIDSRSLALGCVNACSIGNKSALLCKTLIEKRMDLLLITETWHESSTSVSLKRVTPAGFCCVDAARPLASDTNIHTTHLVNHGGLALIYRDSIKAAKQSLDVTATTFEHLCVYVSVGSNGLLLLGVYRPGGQPISSLFFDEFAAVLEQICLKRCPFVICGDLNVHVDDDDDVHAARLADLLQTYDCVQHVNDPTHRDGHTLDVVITDSDRKVYNVSADTYVSDHALVSFKLDISRPRLVQQWDTRRSWRNFSEVSFEEDLAASKLCSDLESLDELSVDDLAELYNDEMQSLLDKQCPEVRVRRKPSKLTPWFDAECRACRRRTRALECRYRRTRKQADRLAWRKQLKTMRALYEDKSHQYWNGKIKDCKGNCKELWRTFSDIMGEKPTQCHADQYDADDFADFFADKVDSVRRSTASTPLQQISATASHSLHDWTPVTPSDVVKLIGAAANKTCQLDPVPTWLVKRFSSLLAPFITLFFNRSLATGCFPGQFKHAVVIPLQKKGAVDGTQLKNYRPVSNLPFLAKLLERVVQTQLQSYLIAHDAMPKHQSAYRRGHSTETALIKIFNDLLQAADKGQVSALCLLDLTAAFDTVDHEVLISRLERRFGLKGSCLLWFQSYLSQRTYCVVLRGVCSKMIQVLCSVPQGSVLGPLLFILYTEELADLAAKHGVFLHAFADDNQLYLHCKTEEAQSASAALERCVEAISCWMSANRLKLNKDKTELIWIGTKNSLQKLPIGGIPLTLGGDHIDVADRVRVLGVLITPDLSLDKHVSDVSGKCFFQLRQIRQIRRSLDDESAATLVHAFVTTRVDYCNCLLTGVPRTTTDKLQRVMNGAARVLTNMRKFDRGMTHVRRHDLHWLDVPDRVKYRLCVTVYKCLHGMAPQYLSDLCTPVAEVPGRQRLRSADRGQLQTPRYRLTTSGGRSFTCAAPSTWNALPDYLKDTALSLSYFEKQLKTFLFSRY